MVIWLTPLGLVSQSELAIAACLGDGELWERAMKKLSIAIGLPWYRRNIVTR
ncbi:host cell division inhibitory peptide Kil [Salmonella enterica]